MFDTNVQQQTVFYTPGLKQF